MTCLFEQKTKEQDKMAIRINLDEILKERRMTSKEL